MMGIWDEAVMLPPSTVWWDHAPGIFACDPTSNPPHAPVGSLPDFLPLYPLSAIKVTKNIFVDGNEKHFKKGENEREKNLSRQD
jgi:hypothetical protein